MEQPLSPREFIRRHHLPQLVRINNAHLHQLNASRFTTTPNSRSLDSSTGTTLSSASLSPSTTSQSSSLNRYSSYQQQARQHPGRQPKAAATFSQGSGTRLKASQHSALRDVASSSRVPEVSLLDIDQPFLLYKAYSSRQVLANTLAPDPAAASPSQCDQSLQKTGPALLIPESYPGWFSLVTGKGQTAGYFSIMDEVARAQVPLFLTRDDVVGFSVPSIPLLVPPTHTHTTESRLRDGSRSEVIHVPGGSVLRFLGVYEDVSAYLLGNGKSSVKKHSTRISKKRVHPPIPYLTNGHSAEHEPGARYVKCLVVPAGGTPARARSGSAGDVVFVPVTERGRFYVIAKKTSRSALYNQVYNLASLLRVIELPATVQLIIGPKPRNYRPSDTSLSRYQSISRGSSKRSDDNNFTSILRLEDLRVREVILASTIRPQPFSISSGPVTRSSSLSMSIRRTLRGNRYSKKSEEPVLLEFDLDSSFTFVRTFCERGGTLTSRKIPELVLNRIEYCEREGELWKKQIKVAHDIIPRLESESSCSSGDGLVSDPHISNRLSSQLSKSRPSIFDADFSGKGKTIRNASIGSRASSNASTSSKLSKILQRFWNPLRRPQKNDICQIEEDVDEDVNFRVSANKCSIEDAGAEHVYETLRINTKKIDDLDDYEAKFYPPAQRISRKQTLDLLFSEFQVDSDGYITKSPSKGKLKDDFTSSTSNC